jgi:hypothetical protein
MPMTEPKDGGQAIRPVLCQTRPRLSPWMARSLARTEARSRLETELRAVAIDLLGRCQPDELPSDCAAWLATTVDTAVTRVVDYSLSALAEALDSRLGAAPRRVVRRLEDAEVRHDAGFV